MSDSCPQNDEGALLCDPLMQRLFRLFILFSDITETGQQRITREQTYFLINHLHSVSRPDLARRPIRPVVCSDTVSFRKLIEICDILYPDRKQLESLVDGVFERFVTQVICKGFVMCKRGSKLKGCMQRDHKWRAYWCTVGPGIIHLWPLHKPITPINRKEISLEQGSGVEVGSDYGERFTWKLTRTKNNCSFSDFDQLRRTHWIPAMQLAGERRTKADLLEYDRECSKRKENSPPVEKGLTWRLALESENARLMQLLDDERRALHDEEIVRTLAARMLEEERERREKLEKAIGILESQLADAMRNETNLIESDKENINRMEDELSNGYMKISAQPL